MNRAIVGATISRDKICPTRVGMNRIEQFLSAGLTYICPTRVGMNQQGQGIGKVRIDICPTRVGMNRSSIQSWYERR